jgi:hypothetical protein
MKTTRIPSFMNPRILLTVLPLLALTPAVSFGQEPLAPPRTSAPPQPAKTVPVPQVNISVDPAEPKEDEKPFSLNFPGGLVQDFVEAVEQASRAPFNVIIPTSAQDLEMPPVKVREVTLTPLLGALSASSREQKPVPVAQQRAIGGGGFGGGAASHFEYRSTGFNFAPTPGAGGSVVWQLTVDRLNPPPAPVPAAVVPPMARFYQLKPNLEAGLKIEDITTVAETAWKMMKLDKKDIPEMKVHEETGLLIAVGSESALSVIDSVLVQLPKKYPDNHPPTPGQPTQFSQPRPLPVPSATPAPRVR